MIFLFLLPSSQQYVLKQVSHGVATRQMVLKNECLAVQHVAKLTCLDSGGAKKVVRGVCEGTQANYTGPTALLLH